MLFNFFKFRKFQAELKRQLIVENEMLTLGGIAGAFEKSIVDHLTSLTTLRGGELTIDFEVIQGVAARMMNLTEMMDFENATEIYAALLWSHAYKNGKRPPDEQYSNRMLSCAVANLQVTEHSGYYTLHPEMIGKCIELSSRPTS